ncbi:conserved hypothetical protein [Arthrobacter sp. FB24]|nr:conserved hypothetical protein [Arthrobacter sp. FB24]
MELYYFPMTGGAPTVLRGSPERGFNLMEQFQVGYINAIAAAAGCNIAGTPSIDEGIDLLLSHRSDQHVQTGAAYLELQLKSTTQFADLDTDYVSSNMRADRYREFISTNPSMDRIVVIMSLPSDPSEWLEATHDQLALRHCCYWVNLRGANSSTAERPTFRAQKTSIFDDVALCGIMQRIGQGGHP